MDTVYRTLDILEIFLKQDGEVGIAEIAELADINVSTAYRITSDLVKRGYLKQRRKRGKYSIGIKLLEYNAVIQRNLRIGEVAQPFLQKLSELSGEYGEVAMLDSNTAVTVAQAEVAHNLRISNLIGERLPLYATSVGKIFLAHMSPSERQVFYSENQLKSFTSNTITDIAVLEKELEAIKKQGFSFDREEWETGVWSVAAPVYGRDGVLAAGLAIAVPSARVSGKKPRELTSLARQSALEISRELGFKVRVANIP